MQTSHSLFSPFQLGPLRLPNRLVMAPMTRGRANPDLVTRFRTRAQLNPPEMATFYTPGPKGYVEYPVLEPAMA